VDAVYAHLRAMGVEVERPVIQYYGTKSVCVTDYDAFMLCFQWAAENVTDTPPKA
jgi:hypothetical protein